MRFAEVAVDAPVGHGRTFSYSVPQSLEVGVGQVVRVPFGPRTLQGVVFSLPQGPQVAETRDIAGTTLTGLVLSDIQLSLARWISDYYMCPLFDAAALMLPPGGRVRLKTYVTPTPRSVSSTPHSLTPYQERVLAYVRGRKRVEEDRLLEAMGRGAKSALSRLVKGGLVALDQAWSGAAIGRKFREHVRLASPAPEELSDGLQALARRAPRRAALMERLLEQRAPMVLAEAREEYGRSAVNGLLAKGWLEKQRAPLDRDPLAGYSVQPESPVALTSAQEKAASEVRAALAEPSTSPRAFLLEGVTGSGKTEVYLDAVRHCLQLGKRAIVLVPEIALTHQTIERFASRFPGQVAVLHSGLTPGQRFDQWWKIRQGEYAVVIGSRGGVFAPQPELGLIVIDEEHEWTYKQHDASPRYHARDVALRLGGLSGSVVVLGSASPDVGSYYKARRGAFRLLRLPDRVVGNGMPVSEPRSGPGLASVEVVDMRRELREGNRSIFSRALLRAIGESLEAGYQTILFLNRRGSASFMQCRRCGYGLRCRRCDVPMTYHGDAQRLLCHHCGDRRIPPDKCPGCLRYRMAYYGVGTQGVVHEISRVFPGVEVMRWDRDSAKRPAEHERLLHRFRSGEAQVLVGTQMIAKGLHFPAVTVVGVVSADVGLNIPDYRAGERAFQLLCQVAGRAGRGPSKGTVVIQTFQPDSYAIKAAATQDYLRFYPEEIAYRREQGNPPFGELIRLLYAHTNVALCEREAMRMSEGLRRERDSWGYSDIEVLGPTSAYPARLKGHYRWQVILRGAGPRRLLGQATLPRGWVVDVDPVGLG
jgi:primosomal protein N' (replication factor Y)